MGSLVHTGLGSSSLVAHVLHSPPPREQLCNISRPGRGGDPRADYERRCLERHGVHAEYDDEFAVCVCAEGYGPDQSEQCVIDLVQVMTWLWQQACASSQHAAVHRVPGYYRRFAR